MNEEILRLFREATEAENLRDLETAKKKLDRIMELSRGKDPEAYFTACFRLADIFIQEDNYRGAVKCAIRAIHRAGEGELYSRGVRMLGDILFMMKMNGKFGELSENMEPTLGLIRSNDELYRFVLALIKLAKGEEVKESFSSKEFNEILRSLRGAQGP